jgi:hypothetical protein
MERVDSSVIPASENLHKSGCEQSQQGGPYERALAAEIGDVIGN